MVLKLQRAIKKLLIWLFLGLLSCQPSCQEEDSIEKPNILWISCEDITTMIGSYGDPNAKTPHLDAFAESNLQYTNSFATAPVCSPARSAIITGYYANTLGSQHLRSEVNIPAEITPFPKYLKKAGYYVTNNSKEDYNFIDTTIWHESSKKAHWQNRGKNQPFFSVFNLTLTHQSSIFGSDSVYQARIGKYLPFIETTSPEGLELPAYYPATEQIKKLWARYYTNVSIIDYQFQKILDQLEADGLANNTIVFFFSDHGTGMPRSKRAVYDSGLKIPLLVRIPEKWHGQFGIAPGTKIDRLVSFIDFAPTILRIAGLTIPSELPGQPFLGKNIPDEKAYVFGAADRVDEGYEMSRTIRNKRFRYIRNFLPHLPLLQPNFYTDQSEIMVALNQVRTASDLSAAQQGLFASRREAEELYLLSEDPDEVNNLATEPEYQQVLKNMRKELLQEMIKIKDTGLMPEPEMIRLSPNDMPMELANNQDKFPVETIIKATNLMHQNPPDAESILNYLQHPNGFVRYWAVISLQALDYYPAEVLDQLQEMIDDDFPTVQIEAAKVLVKNGRKSAANIINRHMTDGEDFLRLYAARTFQQIADQLSDIPNEVRLVFNELKKATNDGQDWSDYYQIYAYWALNEMQISN